MHPSSSFGLWRRGKSGLAALVGDLSIISGVARGTYHKRSKSITGPVLATFLHHLRRLRTYVPMSSGLFALTQPCHHADASRADFPTVAFSRD